MKLTVLVAIAAALAAPVAAQDQGVAGPESPSIATVATDAAPAPIVIERGAVVPDTSCLVPPPRAAVSDFIALAQCQAEDAAADAATAAADLAAVAAKLAEAEAKLATAEAAKTAAEEEAGRLRAATATAVSEPPTDTEIATALESRAAALKAEAVAAEEARTKVAALRATLVPAASGAPDPMLAWAQISPEVAALLEAAKPSPSDIRGPATAMEGLAAIFRQTP